MATEKTKEEKVTPGEAPEAGPVPGTKEFAEQSKAGETIHGPDPTGPSPTTVQLDEQEKERNGQS